MECKGKLNSIAQAYKSKKMIIAFEVEDATKEMIEELENVKALRITAKAWREKRSLDANAYMWVLTDRIAKANNSTVEEEHKRQVLAYSHADDIDGEPVVVTVLRKVDMDRVPGYWHYYDESDDGKWVSYYQVKPTRNFDTKEMSDFLQHIIDEARELGIETATPDELRRMEALYAKKVDKRNS